MAKLFYYSIPLTHALLEFFEHTDRVKGDLTGGFQGLAKELLHRVYDGRLYLDDAIMGRAYRYCETFVPGGWQDTHLPKLIHEVEQALIAKRHKKNDRLPEGTMFDATKAS